MLKNLVVLFPALLIFSCVTPAPDRTDRQHTLLRVDNNQCAGSTELPAALAAQFSRADNAALLNRTLAPAGKGQLCQGKVYISKPGARVMLYRAWNSTNPGSRMGSWWAFSEPVGAVADYRKNYEICYQWSPLDKLVACRLQPGTEVVVGNGQSAECSEYLSYPVSASQQVYLPDPSAALKDCKDYRGEFSWRPEASNRQVK